MKADYRLKCDGPEYAGYLAYASFMMIIYPIGIPVFYFVSLLFQRNNLRRNKSDDEGLDQNNTLVSDFGTDSAAVSKIKISSPRNSISLKSFSEDVGGRLAIERACLDPVTSPYSSLFGAYRPEFWYWECVECLRRLSLTGLLVFLYPGSEKQVLLAMLICFFWMMSYSFVAPYLESSHLFFMMLSQWGVLLQLYAVFLIINRTFEGSMKLIGATAVGIGSCVFVFGILEIVRVFGMKLKGMKSLSKGIENQSL